MISTAPGPQEAAPSPFCGPALRDLAEVRFESSSGVAGYGSVENYLAPPSVYETAWSLRILRLLRVPAARVDRGAAAAALVAAVAQPAATGLPYLSGLADSVEALDALGVSVPRRMVAADLARLRVGTTYRLTPSSAPSMPATALALEIIDESGLRPPPAELAAVLRTVSEDLSLRTEPTESATAAELASLLGVLPPGYLKRGRRAILGLIGDLRKGLLTSPASPVTIYLAADADLIASALRWPAPAIPQSWFASLVLPDGMLADGRGSLADPQTTYDALVAGYRAPPSFAAAVETGEAPSGWADSVLPPTTLTTYEAAKVLWACGASSELRALRGAARSALQVVAPGATAVSTVDIETTYAALSLAELAGAAIPTSLRSALATAVSRALASKLSSSQARLGLLLAAASLLGVTISNRASKEIVGMLTSLNRNSPSTPSVVTLAIGATALHNLTLRQEAAAMVATLRSGSGYKVGPGAPGPDIVSTAAGLELCDAGCPSRSAALAIFDTANGPLFEVGTQRVVSLDSLFYAAEVGTASARVPVSPLIG